MFTYDDKQMVTSMSWTKKEDKDLLRVAGEGKHVIQISLIGHTEQQIWTYYNIIRRVEACFVCLKSDLDIRPVYHQRDESVKALFHLAILAYWIVSTTQYQLKKKGFNYTWREILRIGKTQSVVSTIAKRVDDRTVEIRQCTEPEQRLVGIYEKLNMDSMPLKRIRKICVVHFENIKNKDP